MIFKNLSGIDYTMRKNAVRINNKKAVIWGTVAILLQMGFYYIIWMNPFVNEISNTFADHPTVKPYEYFGGLDNWMQLRTLYLIVMMAIIIKIYLIFYSNIPGNYWQKGLLFGFILSILKSIPDAFNTWTLIVYPGELILLQMINGVIGYLFFGVMLSTLYYYFKVVELPDEKVL